MTTPKRPSARSSIDRHLRIATIASVTLVFGCGGWAATTELSGAVLASGRLVVDASVKKVQHPVGGIVGKINVRNGKRVREGDILISLDPIVVQANLAVLTKALDALVMRQSRLEAERDARTWISVPSEMTERLDDAEIARLMRTELGVFESRRSARSGLRGQLQERILQFEEQILGLTRQAEAFADGMALIRQELTGLEDLYARKLVAVARLMQLKRDEAEIRSSHAQALAEIAQTKGRISETKLQILQIDEELRSEVNGLLSEIQEKSDELIEKKVAAADQLARIDLRAPCDGVVHELSAHTVGGVIEAGETLMLIVPETDDLTVEVRIDVQDRDQVHVGQSATLRMTGFNQRTTPELKGEVTVVAADLVEDTRSGMRYYPVRIALLAGEKERLGEKVLMPGMPVESFVQTNYRTVLSYLVKPFSDYLTRAFRSD